MNLDQVKAELRGLLDDALAGAQAEADALLGDAAGVIDQAAQRLLAGGDPAEDVLEWARAEFEMVAAQRLARFSVRQREMVRDRLMAALRIGVMFLRDGLSGRA